MIPLERDIADLIRVSGPLTGREIKERVEGESLALWQACRSSDALEVRTLGVRYLRLDHHVEGYARLSPSILREFLTYTVVGLAGDPDSIGKRAGDVVARMDGISRTKLDLARRFVDGIRNQFETVWADEQVCFIIAGDIVHQMAHDHPRPERSTGKLVRGSDIDLVVILADEVGEDFTTSLDEAIHRGKYRTLIAPWVNEEIDYVVKRMERVREQLLFDTFKHMVACKILREGMLLSGSRSIFDTIKTQLRETGVVDRLNDLETQARAARKRAEEYLLCGVPERIARADLLLFYSTEESDEFE